MPSIKRHTKNRLVICLHLVALPALSLSTSLSAYVPSMQDNVLADSFVPEFTPTTKFSKPEKPHQDELTPQQNLYRGKSQSLSKSCDPDEKAAKGVFVANILYQYLSHIKWRSRKTCEALFLANDGQESKPKNLNFPVADYAKISIPELKIQNETKVKIINGKPVIVVANGVLNKTYTCKFTFDKALKFTKGIFESFQYKDFIFSCKFKKIEGTKIKTLKLVQ